MMFEEYYAPLPDKAAYLRRIGLVNKQYPLCAETLHTLIRAHLTHVPFENLDVCEKHICPDLAIEALFDKIVTRRRGGYCFEMNGLFYTLLQAMGFDCYPVIGRIIAGRDGIPAPCHRGTIVCVPEGKFYCDVGFGGAASSYPLNLDGTESPDGYRVQMEGRDNVVIHRTDAGEERTMLFADAAAYPVDFLPLNYYMAAWEGSIFPKMPMINLTTENGSKAIFGDTLRLHQDGVLTETKLKTREEFLAALKAHFGLEID